MGLTWWGFCDYNNNLGLLSTRNEENNAMNVNTQWFRARLADKQLSQRQLAKLMNLDPAAVSLALRGQRRMTNEEARQMADLLGVKATELLRQLGVAITDDVKRTPIVGYIDGLGVVTPLPAGTHDRIEGPADLPDHSYALQRRAVNDLSDGWLFFVSGTHEDPDAVVDHLAICTSATGKSYLAHLRRGYKAGTYNLVGNSTEIIENQSLAWAAPVLWVKPV
jgi:transcriptional regulator with XRE-family HTH domain